MKERILSLAIFIIFLFEFSFLAVPKLSNGVSHCDPYGYLSLARLMAGRGFLNTSQRDENITGFVNYSEQKGIKLTDRDILFIFSPHAHYNDIKGQVYNQCPPGYPLLLMTYEKIFGRDKAFSFNLFCTVILSLIIFCLLNYFFAPPVSAFVLVFLLSIKTVFYHTLVIMSDNISILFILAAYLLWLISLERKKDIVFFLSGALLGFSLLIRTANIIALLPIGINQLIYRKRGTVFFYLGFAIPVLALLAYTYSIYKTPFHTTYTYLDLGAFGSRYIRSNISYYLSLIIERFFKVGPLVSLAGLFAGISMRRYRKMAWLVTGLTAVYFISICLFRHQCERYAFPVYMGLSAGLGIFFEMVINKKKALIGLLILSVILYRMAGMPESTRKHCGFRIDFQRLKKTAMITAEGGIIWCEDISSEIRFYNNQLAYRINWGGPEIVKLAIEYFKEKGIPQYFIPDTQNARNAIDALGENFNLEVIDTEIPVYKLG